VELPKEFNILGHKVKVLYPYTFTERGDLDGQYTDYTKTIRIPAQSFTGEAAAESFIAVTVLHEIMHAIDIISGHCIFSTEEGEKALEGISNGLYQVIKDNDLARVIL